MSSAAVLRRLARRAIPLGIRQEAARLRRVRADRAAGLTFGDERGGGEWPAAVALVQPIMPSAVFAAKLANIARGASLLDLNLIPPGASWSFWSRIGKPTAGNGFAAGRNIVEGRLVLQAGGGLCQLSSLLYHLALIAGLEVTERHHHSIDIYREEERFTPLGADATVVWGVRDLRLRNPYRFPVGIGCRVEGHSVRGEIRSEGTIPGRDVRFVRGERTGDTVLVRTIADGLLLCETGYVQRQGMECG